MGVANEVGAVTFFDGENRKWVETRIKFCLIDQTNPELLQFCIYGAINHILNIIVRVLRRY